MHRRFVEDCWWERNSQKKTSWKSSDEIKNNLEKDTAGISCQQ
jgi:hypothetical protein